MKSIRNASKDYGMEFSGEKTKIMTNCSKLTEPIDIGGSTLGTVKSFKNQGAIVSDEGSKSEINARTGQLTHALGKLKPIWSDKNISLKTNVRLRRSLVLSVFLYACKSRTLTAELERKILSVEMRYYRKILGICLVDS